MRIKTDKMQNDKIKIALCGNPNVGKSTVFNELTGLNQHTGNWPGKTVSSATGYFSHNGADYELIDLPGAYSLCPNSAEEEVTRDYICFGEHNVVVAVADATCLERNLNLALQVLYVNPNTVLCINLMDEAKTKGIEIDLQKIRYILKIPVVAVTARSGKGMGKLVEEIESASLSNSKGKISISFGENATMLKNMLFEKLKVFFSEDYHDKLQKICTMLLQTSSQSSSNTLPLWLKNASDVENAVKTAEEVIFSNEALLKKARDEIIAAFVVCAEKIYNECVLCEEMSGHAGYGIKDRRIDKILTSKKFGIPIMLIIVAFVFWLTIEGANYPSVWLSKMFDFLYNPLVNLLKFLHLPSVVVDCIANGIYKTLGFVVSVMLPPMAIFFPLFTLLEDSGILPRIAFNLDKYFKVSGAHGKMALTMCMGVGCNACGVTGCRIIDSKRERLIGMITNSFIPCNGRFPTIIAIVSIFILSNVIIGVQSILTALILVLILALAVAISLITSKILSKTLLKGESSSFVLELPPYRAPQICKVLTRSLLDRTLFVLSRAVCVAAPAGLIIWCAANIYVGDSSILSHCAAFFEPFGRLLGLDGMIVMAFLLGFPANEIVVPIILMGYLSTGSLADYNGIAGLSAILHSNGWTLNTAISMLIAVVFHFPCATTCLTIYKESGSVKWTALAVAIPLVIGITLCMITTFLFSLF